MQHNHQAVTIFDGTNGLNFEMAFSNFARQQGFWDIVDGTRPRPVDNDRAQQQWDRQNGQALNCLRSWIAPKKLHLYLYSPEDTAREVWMRIERRTGGQGAQSRRAKARTRLQHHYQQQGEPLEEWLAGLNERFMDLEKCNFPGMDDMFRKETLLQQIHPMYKNVAQQLDIQMPDASYGDYFNYLLDRVEIDARTDDVPSRGYFSGTSGGKDPKPKQQSHQKKGYQNRGRSHERGREPSGSRHRSASKPRFNGKCNKCRKYGHKQRDCRSGRGRSFSAQSKA